MSDSREAVSEVVDILVDVSGSMGERPDGGKAGKDDPTKLRLVRATLAENVIPMLRNDVAFGLKYFGGDCTTGARTLAEPRLDQADVIRKLLEKDEQANGSTPLAAALRSSFKHLMGYPDADKKMLVFTDGQDTCESKEALDEVIKDFENHNFTVTKGRLSIHAIAVGKISPETEVDLHRIAVLGTVERVEEMKSGDFKAKLAKATEKVVNAPVPPLSARKNGGSFQPRTENRPRGVRGYLIAIIVIQLMTLAFLAYIARNMNTAARPTTGPAPSDSSRTVHDKLDIQAEAIESLSSAITALKEDLRKGR